MSMTVVAIRSIVAYAVVEIITRCAARATAIECGVCRDWEEGNEIERMHCSGL
jgi:hypothetical protein